MSSGTDKYYEQFRNANLVISNNANPFLISPYAPNQGQKGNTAIVKTNTIQPYTPGTTIQVQAPLKVTGPLFVTIGGTNQLTVNSTEALFSVPIKAKALEFYSMATIGPASPVTLQGYAPVTVNGTVYYMPFYSSP
jgi:hypothetical protein